MAEKSQSYPQTFKLSFNISLYMLTFKGGGNIFSDHEGA